MSEPTSKQSKRKKKTSLKQKTSTSTASTSTDSSDEVLLTNEQSKTAISDQSNQKTEIGRSPVETVQKKSGFGLSIFACLLSMIAIGATGYTWYKMEVLSTRANAGLALGVQEISGQITRIGDNVSVLQTTQSNTVTQEQLTTRLLEAKVGVDSKLGSLERDQEDLSESVLKISTDLQKGANEYVIDEVSHLLKLANNNVIFSQNVDGAINAFSLAETQLKELASPRFSKVRSLINEEIELLSSIEQVDIESTLAKLNSISNKVGTLALENEPPVLEVAVEKIDADEPLEWQSEVKTMLLDIVNPFKVQRVGKAPKPLLAPSERYFLDQNFKLALNKAEIALLQGREELYVSNIIQASAWLNDYFDLNDKHVKEVLAQLDELKAITFPEDFPSVAGSYDLLQSIKGGQ